MKRLIIITTLIVLWIGNLQAQSPYIYGIDRSTITLEWDKPVFKEGMQNNITAISSSVILTGRFKVNDNFRAVVDLPVSHYGYDDSDFMDGASHTSLGNIYLGTEIDLGSSGLRDYSYLEMGIRIPTLSEPDSFEEMGFLTGLFSENDRKEAFLPETWVIPVIGNAHVSTDGPLAFKFRLGGHYNIYTTDFSGDNEVHVLYEITTLLEQPGFNAHLGIAGRNHLAGNDPDFFDSGLTQVRGGFSIPFGNWEPGVVLRLPVGENYRDIIDWGFGLSLTYKL